MSSEFVLIDVPDESEWEHPSDVRQLLMSEYHTKMAEIEAAKEKNVTLD